MNSGSQENFSLYSLLHCSTNMRLICRNYNIFSRLELIFYSIIFWWLLVRVSWILSYSWSRLGRRKEENNRKNDFENYLLRSYRTCGRFVWCHAIKKSQSKNQFLLTLLAFLFGVFIFNLPIAWRFVFFLPVVFLCVSVWLILDHWYHCDKFI